jgi:hypothetical protein
METTGAVMRGRRLMERLVAFFLATSLLFATGKEAFGAHLCPHHDRLPVEPAGVAGQADAAHHHGHHGQAVDGHGAVPGDAAGHGNGCTCLGSCQASGGVALVVVGATRADLSGGAVTHAPVREQETARIWLFPHILPYANAPPEAC